jgi:hypothetical protein
MNRCFVLAGEEMDGSAIRQPVSATAGAVKAINAEPDILRDPTLGLSREVVFLHYMLHELQGLFAGNAPHV